MAEHRDHRVLEAALDDLAGHLAWPDTSTEVTARAIDDLRAAPPRRTAGRRPSRWRLVAAVTAITAVLVLVGVPSSRDAVADLLGVGGIRITQTGDPLPDLDGGLDLGRPVSLARASRLSPGPLPQPAVLGAPTAAFAGEPPGGVTLVWAPDETLPEVLDHDIGLLITAFPAGLDGSESLVEKRTSAGGTVQLTDVQDEPAYWLTGAPHQFFYVDEHGQVRRDTIRLSGSALVWAHHGVTYRLETALPLADAVRLAESLPQ